MSESAHLEDDLTTDAIPSPPRSPEPKIKAQNATSSSKTGFYTKSKPAGFTKFKKTTPSAFASVINISNANGIHIGTNYTIYMNKPEELSKKHFVLTDSIKALFLSTIPVQREHIICLSPHMNLQWRDTARALNYSEGQIEQFYEDHIRYGRNEVILKFLMDWIQNEVDYATVGRLSKALWDTSQQDAVIKWLENFPNLK